MLDTYDVNKGYKSNESDAKWILCHMYVILGSKLPILEIVE